MSRFENHIPVREERHWMRNWLTFEEVASELRIPLKSLYLYHYQGRGPHYSRYGKHLRVLEEEFARKVAVSKRNTLKRAILGCLKLP